MLNPVMKCTEKNVSAVTKVMTWHRFRAASDADRACDALPDNDTPESPTSDTTGIDPYRWPRLSLHNM
jgi:hypothetical protein